MAAHFDMKVTLVDVPEVLAALQAARNVIDRSRLPVEDEDVQKYLVAEALVPVRGVDWAELVRRLEPLLPGVPDGT
jgi:hypothetical protein